jgi:hypothetical protein
LDRAKTARLAVQTASAALHVNEWPGEVFGRKTDPSDGESSLLVENRSGDVSFQLSNNQSPVHE